MTKFTDEDLVLIKAFTNAINEMRKDFKSRFPEEAKKKTLQNIINNLKHSDDISEETLPLWIEAYTRSYKAFA